MSEGVNLVAGPRVPRRADIQGVRALAIVLVVAFHAGLPVPGGYIGVDVFFVVSGFVIAAMLVRELGDGRGLGFVRFYARRFRRLLPALAIMTTCVVLASTAFLGTLGPQRATARTGIAVSLFVANVQLSCAPHGGYFDPAAETNALLHTWSLSVEEQFYLVFPALLAAAWVLGRRGLPGGLRRRVFAVVALGVAASFAVGVILTLRPSERLGDTFAFYQSITRAWEFGAGVLLALCVPRLERLGARVGQACMVSGLGLIGVAAFAFDGATPFPGIAALVPVTGAVLVIAGGTVARGGVARGLAARPAVWIGDVSYAWYLWHWPLIVFAAAWWPGRLAPVFGAALASLLVAVLAKRFVEDPIRFADGIVGRRAVVVVAVCVTVPILASVAAIGISSAQARTDRVAAFARTTRQHADRDRGCDELVPLAEREQGACTWPAKGGGARGEIVLVGDSNAGQFTEPVTAAGSAAGYDVVVATAAGCPFVDLIRRSSGWLDPAEAGLCHDQVLGTVDDLVRRHPAAVIMAMTTTEYLLNPGERLEDPTTGRVATSAEAKAELWEQGLRRVIEPLAEAGVPVVVAQTIPQFGAVLGDQWSSATCPALKVLVGAECGGSRSRAAVEQDQALGDRAQERAVEGSGVVVGFNDALCTPSTCSTERWDLLLYRDATHLSVPGAETLTPVFADAIDDVVSRP